VTALIIAAIALGLVLVVSILTISLGLAQSAAHGDAVMRRTIANFLRRKRKDSRAA
jgi:ABC-type antimicrobial peptide transport system permease subunit